MAKRYRLLAPAQMHGCVREPGYEFELEDGVLGPHTSVQRSPDLHASSIDALLNTPFTGRSAPLFDDIPLYEPIETVEDVTIVKLPNATKFAMLDEIMKAERGGKPKAVDNKAAAVVEKESSKLFD